MIVHGFKTMWNQKRKYGFILFELFVIFLIVIATLMYMIDQLSNYLEGTGCEISQVYYINLERHAGKKQPEEDPFSRIPARLERLKGVESASISRYAAPHLMQFSNSSFRHADKITRANIQYVDRGFREVLKLNLIDGRWFGQEGHASGVVPVVINRQMAVELFGQANPVGRRIKGKQQRYRVVGVIGHYKKRSFQQEKASIFIPATHPKTGISGNADLLIRYSRGSFPRPRAYAREVFSVLSTDHFRIGRSMKLALLREQSNANASEDISFVGLLVGFLVFNLVLGLIGILGYNVNQRWSEMGIRRAVGATQGHVRRLIFSELFALTAMAFIPALLLLVQIPALDLMPLSWGLFTRGMVASLIVILLLVTASVLYPGIKASKIEPAVALKEE